jgi:hypothetical protein
MKKLLIVVFITLFIPFLASAQIYKGFGVKIGTSVANIQSNYFYLTTNYKIGLSCGVFKETKIFDELSFVVGVNYAQKGFRLEILEMDEFGKYLGISYEHQNINFLNAELNLKYGDNNEKFSSYFFAGLRADFLISHNVTYKGNDLPYDLISFDKSKSFGGIFGVGISFKPSKLYSVFIEGAYSPDFTNLIERHDIYNSNYDYWVRGNSFDIRAGIKF